MTYLEFFSLAITPLVVLMLGVLYKGLLEKVVTSFQSIKVKLPAIGEIEMSSVEAGEKLSELFSEFYTIYNQLLKEHERSLFRKILSLDHQATVSELLPEFKRDKKWLESDIGETQIGMLRAIRGLGLIAPVGGKEWKPESKIEVTKFGKSLTGYIKSYI